MSTYTVSTIEELALVSTLNFYEETGYSYEIESGDLVITSDMEIPSLLLSDGSLVCQRGLVSTGNITVSDDITISESVSCMAIRCVNPESNITVGQDVYSIGECYSGSEGDISIGGNLTVGSARTKNLHVGGSFYSSSWAVAYGLIEVGGSIITNGFVSCTGGGITAGGNISVTGDITCANGTVSAG